METSANAAASNRWPRAETSALIKIRSEMDAVFRDSTLKAPLWDEVSRKMAELGFQRSGKKCKEKFENVYKYHKRTKEGRATKSDGKTYRFFDDLAALENAPPTAASSPNPVSVLHPTPNNFINNNSNSPTVFPPPFNSPSSTSPSSDSESESASTSSDEDIQRRQGRKRKWKEFFQRLLKDVVEKQEELQKKFLETLDKRERDRTAREDALRMQETARINREHELLVKERSIAAAKDAAVIAFLQKVTDQPTTISTPPMQPQPTPPIAATPVSALTPAKISDTPKTINSNSISSRWPKAEVEALIKLRMSLENKYQENAPKGPLWEEISTAMAEMGYSRSSKRCKEKWENINKYFKKVKESNRKRPEDCKTCPYFNQLDAIYKHKIPVSNNSMLPVMAPPEQQWTPIQHADNESDREVEGEGFGKQPAD